MMNELEVSAMAIAVAIDATNAKGWGKDHVERASTFIKLQMKSGNISLDDFTTAVARVSGNQSGMAQTLEEWGLIERDRKGKSKPALISAIDAALPLVRRTKDALEDEQERLGGMGSVQKETAAVGLGQQSAGKPVK